METEEIAPAIDEAIHLAFDLPPESGVDLLLRLGEYDVWRGDLGAMRGDVPRPPSQDVPPPSGERLSNAERLYDAVVLKKAFGYLQPACVEVLRLRYAERREIIDIAAHLATAERYAEKLVRNCRQRLYELAKSMKAAMEDCPKSGVMPAAPGHEVQPGKSVR